MLEEMAAWGRGILHRLLLHLGHLRGPFALEGRRHLGVTDTCTGASTEKYSKLLTLLFKKGLWGEASCSN